MIEEQLDDFITDQKRRLDERDSRLAASSKPVYVNVQVRESKFSTGFVKKQEVPRSLKDCSKLPIDGTTKTCCLYPWPNSGTLYPSTDLPNTLLLDAVTFTFGNDGEPSGSPLDTDYFYHSDWTTDEAGFERFVIFQDFEDWTLATEVNPTAPSPSGVVVDSQGSSLGCLTDAYGDPGNDPVTDNFSSTYTVNGVDTITRRPFPTSCVWSGPKTGGGMWKLDYGQTTPYKWHLHSSTTDDDKTSPQSSPTGSYGSNSIS